MNRYVAGNAERAGRPASRALQTPASMMAESGAFVGPVAPGDPRSYRTIGPGAFAVQSPGGPIRPFPLMSPIPLQMQMQMGVPLQFAFPTSPGPGAGPVPTSIAAGSFPQYFLQQPTPGHAPSHMRGFQPTPSPQHQHQLHHPQLQQLQQAPSNGIVYLPQSQSQQRGRHAAAADSSLV